MSDVARILKEARDQGRLTAWTLPKESSMISSNFMVTVISVMMVPLSVVLVA